MHIVAVGVFSLTLQLVSGYWVMENGHTGAWQRDTEQYEGAAMTVSSHIQTILHTAH